MNTTKHFDAYLTFSPISADSVDRITQLFSNQELEIQVYDNALEFSFEGRDLSDRIVEMFVTVACILREANGELRCEIDDENDDPHFEFFTISNSKLWRQRGRIVRSEKDEVYVSSCPSTFSGLNPRASES